MDERSHTYRRATATVRAFYRTRKRMPSFRELGDELGLRSKNAVSKVVARLVERGVLGKDVTGRLIPANLFGDLRVLGTVEAGFPSSAEEEFLDTVTLDEWLVGNREASFVLRVTGESMKDAGIQAGDIVVVERGKAARVGDIVVAEVDGEWTMKYLRQKGSRRYLEPANRNYKAIYPKEELVITAVVVAVVRKYE